MLFNSVSFLIFFPIVVAIFFIIPKKARYLWLLVASYYFYMSWNPTYVLLLLLSTAVTYGCGLLLGHFQHRVGVKKSALSGCLVLNFGILFLYKYLDFFWKNLGEVLERFHLTLAENSLELLLPVGISFYTFQAVGYCVDVYRGKLAPEKNFFRYALFVSFFPQLVAGPIERSENLLPQLKNIDKKNLWDSKRIQAGAIVALYGFFLKMIVADRAAIYVNTIFDVEKYATYKGIPVLIGAILFSLQIYGDFAGYTYIAIGAAKIMGVELMENFRMPYLAQSIKDFWDRWHISLSGWFREYLYFPLGGSRKGKIRKYFNILVVFTVSGLWHGADWHYVVWGALHGIFRVIGESTLKIRNWIWTKLRVNMEAFSFKLWRVIFTFVLVTFAWVFFRAESLQQGAGIVQSVFKEWNPWVLFDGELMTYGLDTKEWNVLLIAILLVVIVDVLRYKKIRLTEWFLKQNLLFRWLVFYGAIIAVAVLGVYGAGYNATEFIYFQF